jgi:hypothetical protein
MSFAGLFVYLPAGCYLSIPLAGFAILVGWVASHICCLVSWNVFFTLPRGWPGSAPIPYMSHSAHIAQGFRAPTP